MDKDKPFISSSTLAEAYFIDSNYRLLPIPKIPNVCQNCNYVNISSNGSLYCGNANNFNIDASRVEPNGHCINHSRQWNS